MVAIADIDTRKLTRILREKGAQNGCLIAGDGRRGEGHRPGARAFPGLAGMDLAKVVSVAAALRLERRRMDTGHGLSAAPSNPRFHVVAYDFGVKRNILRMLAERGCRLTVVPAQTPPPRCWR